MMSVRSSIIFKMICSLSIICGIVVSSLCGNDCRLCDQDSSECNNDPSCTYLLDNQQCHLINTCESDCKLCSIEDCVSKGGGGNGVCFISETQGTCVGLTCDLNCDTCPLELNPGFACENSNAPPYGCMLGSFVEDCRARTEPKPTTEPPASSCGNDCRSCDQNPSQCNDDPSCTYLLDNQQCHLVNTCESDCKLCSIEDCASKGGGGNGVCFVSGSTNTCVGSTCDLNCGLCPLKIPPGFACENSNAPPYGCMVRNNNVEDCVPKTEPPSTTGASSSCGNDCRLCDQNPSQCNDNPSCVYLWDNQQCHMVNTCESDCRLCSNEDCVSKGGGGNGVCDISFSDGTCVGFTCDLDCGACFSPPDCINSRALPNGCMFGSSIEECIPKIIPSGEPAEWMMPTNPSVPRDFSDGTAIGWWNDKIYLIGPDDKTSSFDINDETFNNPGSIISNNNSIQINAGSYTQLSNLLFVNVAAGASFNDETIVVFDLSSPTFYDTPNRIIVPSDTLGTSCIAGREGHEYLYVSGGDTSQRENDYFWWDPFGFGESITSSVQVYDLEIQKWTNYHRIRSMQQARENHFCGIDKYDNLYAIGGNNDDGQTLTIERVDVSSELQDWEYIESMPDDQLVTRPIFDNNRDVIYWINVDTVYILDMIDGTFARLSQEIPPYPLTYGQSVLIDPVIYHFADEWLKYYITTTIEPSTSPTAAPTDPPQEPGQWVSPSGPLMPRASSFQAVGQWEDDIFLLFGRNRDVQQQAFTYNTSTGKFTDYGRGILPPEVYNNNGYGQFYTQTAQYLYMYPQNMRFLWVFDLSSTNWYEPDTISGVRNMWNGGCIASNDDYLFTLGGGPWDSPYNTMQMYDLSNQTWINANNLPLLQQKRGRHSCVVDNNNMLYAIGGYNGGYIKTIERVSIDGIVGNTWQFIDNLSKGIYGSRAISYLTSIIIIGGSHCCPLEQMDTIHIIDIRTGNVAIGSHSLNLLYGVSSPSVVINQQTLYAFGGYVNSQIQDTDKWQYYTFPDEF